MTRRPRTLAGRMSVVQTLVTVAALVSVAVATVATVTTLLSRRSDRILLDVANRVASIMERLPPETTDPIWVANEAEEQRPPGARVEVRAEDGRLLASAGERFDLPASQVGCDARGVLRVCGARSAHFQVVVGGPREGETAAEQYLFVALIVVTLVAAGSVAALSRMVARRGLRPLTDFAARVAAIEPGAGTRVATSSGFDELDAFSARFDDLLARFDAALERERRLAAQASHELRTPLTLARVEIESAGAVGASRESIARALAAIDRLSSLVEALLWFAKAETPLDVARMDVVNLADILRAQVADRPSETVAFTLPDEALVRGDERLLSRVTANLLDNAIKYGRSTGIVEVVARRVDGRLAVTIANAGVVARDVEDRAFEPFFRGTHGAPHVPGFGLGLPFARAVARSHGGDVVLDRGRSDSTAFVLTIPLVAWSDEQS